MIDRDRENLEKDKPGEKRENKKVNSYISQAATAWAYNRSRAIYRKSRPI